MALKQATKVTVPFTDQKVKLTNPGQVFGAVVALILGFTFFHMTDAIGSRLGGRVNAMLGGFLPGGNPAEDGDSNIPGV